MKLRSLGIFALALVSSLLFMASASFAAQICHLTKDTLKDDPKVIPKLGFNVLLLPDISDRPQSGVVSINELKDTRVELKFQYLEDGLRNRSLYVQSSKENIKEGFYFYDLVRNSEESVTVIKYILAGTNEVRPTVIAYLECKYDSR